MTLLIHHDQLTIHHSQLEQVIPCIDKIFFLNYKRTSFTHGGKQIYYQRRYYRSDRVAYDLELERRPGKAHPAALRDFEPVFK